MTLVRADDCQRLAIWPKLRAPVSVRIREEGDGRRAHHEHAYCLKVVCAVCLASEHACGRPGRAPGLSASVFHDARVRASPSSKLCLRSAGTLSAMQRRYLDR